MTAQTDILALLADLGESLTLISVTTGVYDPATSSVTETTTNHSITAAVVNYNANQIDGTLIQAGDRKVIVAASGLAVTPKQNDKVTGLGDTVRVISVRTFRESGSTVAYVLQVRE